jgi:hypothetical protein
MTLKIRVNRPAIEDLSAQCTPDPRQGSIVSDVQTKLQPLLLVHLAHIKNHQKQNKIEKFFVC